MKYFFLLCLGFGLLLTGCAQKHAGSGARMDTAAPLQTPLEGQMTVDSTEIGVSTIACHQADGNGVACTFPPLR